MWWPSIVLGALLANNYLLCGGTFTILFNMQSECSTYVSQIHVQNDKNSAHTISIVIEP